MLSKKKRFNSARFKVYFQKISRQDSVSGTCCEVTSATGNFPTHYRSVNAIVGKVGRVAKEDVVLELLSSKCLPSLLYGLEACPLVKSDLSSLDFVINRFFMKLFKTNNIDVVKTCQQYFNFVMPSTLWTKRSKSFESKFSSSENVFCKITRYII